MRKVSCLFGFLLLFLLPHTGKGQVLNRFADTFRVSMQSKPKFFLGFDTRRSFISSRDVKVFGLRTGLEFNHRVRFGLGAYGLSSQFFRNYIQPNDSTGLPDTLRTRMKFGYISGFVEYVFLRKKRWEVSVPFHLGLGSSTFLGFERQTRGGFLLTEASLQAQYKIFSFLGLGGGLGYRYLVIPNRKIGEDFNSAIYLFKVKIFLGPIVKAIFKKKEDKPKDKAGEK